MFLCFFFHFCRFFSCFLCNCVITFNQKDLEPSAPSNERLDLSFAEDLLVIGKKITTKGDKTAIYQSRKFWRSVSTISSVICLSQSDYIYTSIKYLGYRDSITKENNKNT